MQQKETTIISDKNDEIAAKILSEMGAERPF